MSVGEELMLNEHLVLEIRGCGEVEPCRGDGQKMDQDRAAARHKARRRIWARVCYEPRCGREGQSDEQGPGDHIEQ